MDSENFFFDPRREITEENRRLVEKFNQMLIRVRQRQQEDRFQIRVQQIQEQLKNLNPNTHD